MATLTIRNLPDDLLARIKESARRNQQSMEQEIRDLLAVLYRDRDALAAAVAESCQRQRRPTTPAEIEAWRREGRP